MSVKKNIERGVPVEKARRYARDYKQRRRDRERLNAFSWKYPYTREEDEAILKREFSDSELAKIYGRQTSAIQKRRWDLRRKENWE